MTRINLVDPTVLSDKHLVAEYREIVRLPNNLKTSINRKGKPFNMTEIPEQYKLGKSHVKFFYDKMKFLQKRHKSLVKEMQNRGFRTNFTDSSIFIPDNNIFYNDYIPTREAIELNKERIIERTKKDKEIVYKFINKTRLKNGTPPYYYIGSKTNCAFVFGKIYDKFNKEYWSSTKNINLKQDLSEDVFEVEVLFIKNKKDETSITFYEREEQLKVEKSIWNVEYYNNSYANGKFTTKGKAVYVNKHNKGEVLLLDTSDARVLDGTFIALSKGRKASKGTLNKLKERPHPSEGRNWSEFLTGIKKYSNENYKGEKSENHRKNIAKSKYKSVIQKDLSGNILQEFESIKQASELTGVGRNSISACCNGRTKTGHGFIWEHK